MKIVFLSFQQDSAIIGVKYLHAYVASKGYDSSILLVPNGRPENVAAAVDHIIEGSPHVLAVSCEFAPAVRFLLALRERWSSCCPIVFGGIHATADPESCLAVADVVVRAEGEETLLALLQALDGKSLSEIGDIPGTVRRRSGKIVHAPVRPALLDPDTLPYPEHLPKAMAVVHRGAVYSIREPAMVRRYARRQGRNLFVLASRGCPFACDYCCNSLFHAIYGNRGVRQRTPESVVDEIVREVNQFPNILYVTFQDDCFLFYPRQWIARFSALYEQKVGIPFLAMATPNLVDREKLRILKRAGLRWIFIGLQTGSDRIRLEVYNRNVTAETFVEATHIVANEGLVAWYDVIVDNPYEEESDHLETIEVLLRIPRPFILQMFSLVFFPGTALRKRAEEDGLELNEMETKPYTKPEPKMINRYIRMCATLPRGLVRVLVRARHKPGGRWIAMGAYGASLFLEPVIYLGLLYKTNDLRLGRTIRAVHVFAWPAFRKFFLRK